MSNLKALVFAASTLLLPVTANAQVAYTTEAVPLHAGPAEDYPVVAILGTGFPVTVQGCMQDYSWCDVIAGPHRGWVYARDIVYSYQGQYVPVLDYGAAIGIGVATFIIGNYWHDHYARHPWYRQMPRWNHRPPRAAIHAGPPRGGAHSAGARHSAPAYRSPQWQPNAAAKPRPLQAGPRQRNAQSSLPAFGPFQRPANAGVNPRPAQRGAGERSMPRTRSVPTPRFDHR
ncbi:MAG: peptide-binding protein [Burkholderiales bacterium]|nr:peptide-binding protein [Burkholderiales bacterium]